MKRSIFLFDCLKCTVDNSSATVSIIIVGSHNRPSVKPFSCFDFVLSIDGAVKGAGNSLDGHRRNAGKGLALVREALGK